MRGVYVDNRSLLPILFSDMDEPQRIDFHTHSFLSDGVLLPSEMLRRATALGYKAMAITDHADASNLGHIIESLWRIVREQPHDFGTRLIVGLELTHVGLASIDKLARQAKRLGAEVVVVHGETIVEPVISGTNRAAVESRAVDILAHPGFLTLEEARLAAERGCYIEITTRKGHSLTNGHIARICREAGAPMLVNSDTHEPANMVSLEFAQAVAAGAGLAPDEVRQATVDCPMALLTRVLRARKQWL